MTDRTAEEAQIAERLEKRIKTKDAINSDLAKKLVDELVKQLGEVEPLGDLNLPINDVLALIASLQQGVDESDFRKIMMVIAMMYDIEDETTFMKRLSKTVLMLGEPTTEP